MKGLLMRTTMRRMRWRYRVCTAALLLVPVLLMPRSRGEEQVIGSADASFEIERDAPDGGGSGGGAVEPAAVPGAKQQAGKAAGGDKPTEWKVTEVKVVRVINRGGNNPLMPEEPVFNEDGQAVGEDGDGDDCAGKSAQYAASAGGVGEATLLYDPGDGFCDVRSGLVAGDRRGFFIYLFPADGLDATKPWISLGAADMTFWDGAGYWEQVTQGQVLVFTATHVPTGDVYQFTIQVDVNLAGKVTLLGIVKQ